MSDLNEIGSWVRENLPTMLADAHIPAASVAILAGGEIFTTAAGILNRNTGVEADEDSVFQIGSITKTWTATLVMQLVDEGLLDLDVPVRDTVPAFAIGDDAAASAITTRQLLSHVSGFEGDLFNDTGVGDDAVEKYLATIADAPQLFAPVSASPTTTRRSSCSAASSRCCAERRTTRHCAPTSPPRWD